MSSKTELNFVIKQKKETQKMNSFSEQKTQIIWKILRLEIEEKKNNYSLIGTDFRHKFVVVVILRLSLK